MSYAEAEKLFYKLREAGYPAQIWYHDNKWKVQVEQVITNNETRLDKL
jgi:hypothetical protein